MPAKLTDRASIPAVVAKLTLDEKISLLRAETSICTTSIPAHDIPSIVLTDGVTGINFVQLVLDFFDRVEDKAALYGGEGVRLMSMGAEPIEVFEQLCADDETLAPFLDRLRISRRNGKDYICFPSGINIGASFDTDKAYAIGRAVGLELRDSGVDVCLGPNVDIMRDPLGGRNYEMYGEDPLLVSRIAAAFIRGLQSTGVGGCAKHLIVNNQENRRNSVDTHVSKRTLLETYAAGFRAAAQSGVMTMMSSLNKVNGEFSSYNKGLLTDLLREEWGFEGAIVSDWGAASAHPDRAVAAGLDIILPGKVDVSAIRAAVDAGELPIELIDAAVSRVLALIVDVKAMQAAAPAEYDREALALANKQCVIDGAVLLKNDDVLPIGGEKLAFWGEHSRALIKCGSGSTEVRTALASDPYSSTLALLGGERVSFETWDGAEVLVYTAAADAGEGADRDSMELEPNDRAALPVVLREAKSRGLKTVVLLNVPGPVDVSGWIDDADAVLCLFLPGSEGGNAAAELLCGIAEPGGRLPATFPLHYRDTPVYPNFPGEHDDVFYGEEGFIGYRHYDARRLPVAFPFGHGLSYTTFEMKPLSRELVFDIEASETAEVAVEITNTGSRTGRAVVQLYASEENPRLRRPDKELLAFAGAILVPGETKTLTLRIDRRDLARFDPRFDKWVTPVGEYRLRLATSAEEIFAELPMKVVGQDPYLLGEHSTLGEVMAREDAVSVLTKHFPAIAGSISDLRLLSTYELGAFLTSYIIRDEPDANKVSALLAPLYCELAELG